MVPAPARIGASSVAEELLELGRAVLLHARPAGCRQDVRRIAIDGARRSGFVVVGADELSAAEERKGDCGGCPLELRSDDDYGFVAVGTSSEPACADMNGKYALVTALACGSNFGHIDP